MVVVLPEPLTPTTRMTNGLPPAISSGFATGPRIFATSPASTTFTSSPRIALSKRPSLERRGDAARDADAEVGADQGLLDLLQHGRIERALADQVRRARLPSADEVRFSPPVSAAPPARDWLRFSDLSAHAGCRDTRSAMTPEEIVSRLLYRDGLMLIIDKPAGARRAQGPEKAARQPGGPFRRAALRPAAAAGRWPTGSTRTPPAAWCSAATARRWRNLNDLFRDGKVGKTYWAVVEGGPSRGRGPDRHAARPRSTTTLGWWMKHDPNGQPSQTHLEGDGPRRRRNLARAGADHRADAPTSRALRRSGCPIARRQHLRHRAARPAARRCICMRARSRCRSTRTSRRSR